jgi:LPS sulfotransferase NodH
MLDCAKGGDVNYIICSTQRSGSTLLADTLELAGVGRPGEFFQMTGKAVDDMLASARNSAANGYLGVKMHYYQLVAHDLDRSLPSLFPDARYIGLTRRNVLRQAISLVRARQTDAWTSLRQAVREPIFDWQAIDACVREIVMEVEGWERFYRLHAIRPLRVLYEELEEDFVGTFKRVLAFLGMDARVVPPRLKRQADAITEEWVRRRVDQEHSLCKL